MATTQRDLFRPMCGTVHTRQPELFDQGGRVSALSCSECGRPMEETPGGYLACPMGHGRLSLEHVEDDQADRSGLWFEDDLTDPT